MRHTRMLRNNPLVEPAMQERGGRPGKKGKQQEQSDEFETKIHEQYFCDAICP